MTDAAKNTFSIEDLIIGHFDGTLNESQEIQLTRALIESTEAQQLFLEYMRMEGRLHSLGRDGFLHESVREPVIQTKQSSSSRRETAPIVWRDRQRLLAASTLAVCAAVLLMLLSGVLWPSSVNASNVLQREQQAVTELVDRTYRVTLSDSATRSPTRDLTINVRGGSRFLIRPADEAFIMGSDGREYWASQSGNPVWRAVDSRSLARRLRRNFPNMWLFEIAKSPNEPLLLDIHGLLSLIGRRHNVELIASNNPAEHHVKATLKRGRRDLALIAPRKIDFWADSTSGVVLRAEARWSDGRQMQFELVESVQLSDEWYHWSQHASDSEVRSLPDENRSWRNGSGLSQIHNLD